MITQNTGRVFAAFPTKKVKSFNNDYSVSLLLIVYKETTSQRKCINLLKPFDLIKVTLQEKLFSVLHLLRLL